MRTATFTASSIAEGYSYIKDNFGDDALVVRVDGGVKSRSVEFTVSLPDAIVVSKEPVVDIAKRRMQAAGFDGAVLARLEQFAAECPANDPGDLIDAYVRSRLKIRPFVDFAIESRGLLFLGPPGAGKTTTIAKAAATLLGAGKRVVLASLEKDRLGGDSQLAHLASLLGLPLVSFEKAEHTDAALRGVGRVDCILADAPSIHPWRVMDVDDALTLAHRLAAVPLMVVPAGLEARETADNLATVRRCGVENAIVTKCDVTRRLGTLLNALILERFTLVGLQQSRMLTEKISASDPNTLKLAFNLQA